MSEKPMRLLRLPEVIRKVGLSKTTIYKRAREGSFPKPVDLGGGQTAWVESEIDSFIDNLIAGRDGIAA